MLFILSKFPAGVELRIVRLANPFKLQNSIREQKTKLVCDDYLGWIKFFCYCF